MLRLGATPPRPSSGWDLINHYVCAGRPLSPPRPQHGDATTDTTPHTSLLHLTFTLPYQLGETSSHIATRRSSRHIPTTTPFPPTRSARRPSRLPPNNDPGTPGYRSGSFLFDTLVPPRTPSSRLRKSRKPRARLSCSNVSFVVALLVNSRQDGEWSTVAFPSSTYTSRTGSDPPRVRNIPSTAFGISGIVTRAM